MKKRKGIGLITLIIIIATILIITGILAFVIIKNSNGNKGIQNSDSKSTGIQNNRETNVTYSDASRDIKSTYTFDEATSKFAFKEYETTLIFEEKDNLKISAISLGNISAMSFYYEKDDSNHFTFQFEESSSLNVNDFVNNFKNGVLGGGKKQLSFKNIKILELNDEYAFISCQQTANPSYNYYFAKKIGGKVFYAYSERHLDELNEDSKAQMLIGFKELFGALSSDDNKEPYICDKIMNVLIVLNKQINSYQSISNIQLVHPKSSTANYRHYMKGHVTLYSEDDKRIEIYYDAEKLYNKVEWTKELTSKLKYSEKDNFFGIKDNNITQMFQISTSENINNDKDFNEYLNKFLINK